MPRQSIAEKRRVPGVRLVTHQMWRLWQVGAAHILPTSGAGAHHTLPSNCQPYNSPFGHGSLLHQETKVVESSNHQRYSHSTFSVSKFVSKHSLVLNDYTYSPKPGNEGRLIRTCKQNWPLSNIQTSALNQSRYFLEIFDQLMSFWLKLEVEYMCHICDGIL